MKKFQLLLVLLLILMINQGLAQNGFIDTAYTPDNKMHINKSSMYPGGEEAFYKDISTNFKLPPSAIKDKVHGKIIIQITIDISGKVTVPVILQGLSEDLDKAAIKMTLKLKRFVPSMMDNKPVPTTLKIPIKI